MAGQARPVAPETALEDPLYRARGAGGEVDPRSRIGGKVPLLLVCPHPGARQYVRRNPARVFHREKLAAERITAPRCGRRSVSAGGREGAPDGGSGGAGRAGPYARRAY